MFRGIIAALLLAASFAAHAKKAEPTPAERASTHGLVTARLYSAGLPPGVTGFLGLPPSLVLRPVGEKNDGNDIPLVYREGDAASAGAWVPAGRYRLARWRETEWDGPEVDVVAGRLVDLGGLLEVSLGGYDVTLAPMTHPELADDLAPWLAEAGDVLADRTPLHASFDAVPAPFALQMQSTSGVYGGGLIMNLIQAQARKAQRVSERDALRTLREPAAFQQAALAAVPPVTTAGVADDAGQQIFGATFGRLRVRAPDGVWNTVDTGTLATIEAVHHAGGRFVAGTSTGELRAGQETGPWSSLRDLGDERVRDIDRADGRWFVVTTHSTDAWGRTDALTVWSGRADDFSDLAPLRRFDQEIKNRGDWVPRGQVARGGFYVNPHPALWRYELASGEWRDLDADGPERFHVADESGVITLVGRGVQMAEADGAKFRRVAWQLGRPEGAWLETESEGWGVGWTNPSPNTVAKVIGRKVAARGARAWSEVAKTPVGCLTVMLDSAGEPRWCADALGTILARDGAEWTPEFVAE